MRGKHETYADTVKYLFGRTSWGRIPLASMVGGPPLLCAAAEVQMGTSSTSTATSIADEEASRLAPLSFHRTTSWASEVLWCTMGAYLEGDTEIVSIKLRYEYTLVLSAFS